MGLDPGNESVYFIFLCLAANGVESRPHPQAVVASILKGGKPAAVQRSMSMKATPQPLPRSPITSEGWWAWHIPAVNKFNVHVYVGGCVTWTWGGVCGEGGSVCGGGGGGGESNGNGGEVVSITFLSTIVLLKKRTPEAGTEDAGF